MKTMLILTIVLSSCTLPAPEQIVFYYAGQSNVQESTFNELIKNIPNSVGNYARHPGESIANWYKDGIQQINHISDCEKMKTLPEIDFFIWFQGEADASDARYPFYKQRFIDMKESIQNNFGYQIQFIILQVSCNTDIMDNIREVQQNIADTNGDIYIFDTAPYERLSDDTAHLTASEYVRLGQDLANYIMSLNVTVL